MNEKKTQQTNRKPKKTTESAAKIQQEFEVILDALRTEQQANLERLATLEETVKKLTDAPTRKTSFWERLKDLV